MAYTKQTWSDSPSTATPLSAARLGHMEDGIDALDTWVDKTPPTGTVLGTTDTQTLTNKTVGDRMDYTTVSQPATPSAGTARLYARIGVSGVESMAYINTLGVPIVLGRDICAFVKNTSGATITKGSVVTINSSSASIPLVIKSQADAGMTKIPAAGIMAADIANNSVGLMMITGTINGVNTSGVGAGNTLYVSPTTAGLFTDTKPSHPLVAQTVGECLNSNATTGAILVNVTEANMGLLEGVNGSSWSVGDGTGAGAKSVLFKNNNTGTLSWTPTGSRTLTLPDATTTLDGTDNTATLTNKRVTPRIGTTASTATPSIDCGIYDQYNITALAANITSVTVTGTPTDGQKLLMRITGTATRTIAWGASFQSSGVATLLATTSGTNTHLVGFIYDGVDAKWTCVAVDATGY